MRTTLIDFQIRMISGRLLVLVSLLVLLKPFACPCYTLLHTDLWSIAKDPCRLLNTQSSRHDGGPNRVSCDEGLPLARRYNPRRPLTDGSDKKCEPEWDGFDVLLLDRKTHRGCDSPLESPEWHWFSVGDTEGLSINAHIGSRSGFPIGPQESFSSEYLAVNKIANVNKVVNVLACSKLQRGVLVAFKKGRADVIEAYLTWYPALPLCALATIFPAQMKSFSPKMAEGRRETVNMEESPLARLAARIWISASALVRV